MPGPTIHRAVSETSLSKPHTSTTIRHHVFSSKPPSSPKPAARRPNLGSKRDHQNQTLKNIFSSYTTYGSAHSPYYKGLLDQSLVIHHHEPPEISQAEEDENPIAAQIQGQSIHECSPYYKGLLDQSLVIATWIPSNQKVSWVDQSDQNHMQNQNPILSSPYYKGLLDQSLVIPAKELAEAAHLGSASHSSSRKSIVHERRLGSCFPTSKTSSSNNNDKKKSAAESGLNPEQIMCSSPPKKCKTELSMKEEEEKKEENNKNIGGVNKLDEIKELNVKEDMNLEKKEVSEYGLVGDDENMKEPLRESMYVSEQHNIAGAPNQTPCEGGDVIKEMLEDMTTKGNEKKYCEDGDAIMEKLEGMTAKRNEKKYVWTKKHQPKSLEDFICNKDKASYLQNTVKEGCGCNHFIFEGPSGSGKRSMIRAMLREVFGADKVEVIEEYKTFSLKGEMVDSIQVCIKKSTCHVEVNLSETKGYEEHVIVDLFKETDEKVLNNSLPCSPDNCQAIIIHEAERLSTESLLYIKWLLERYKGCNKVFFCCSDESKLQPIKPLCIAIHLKPPSTKEIVEVLGYIAKQEAINISTDFLRKIVEKSKRNLRQAIRSFEATWKNKPALVDDLPILTGWEDDISNIARDIIEEQSPKQLYIIHGKLQILMNHNVAPDFIFKCLITELNSLVDESVRSGPGVAKLNKDHNKDDETKLEYMKQFGVVHSKVGELNEWNDEITNGPSYSKIEEFVAKFMSSYKNSSAKRNEQMHLDTET